jgi:hypothetical protein
MNQYVTGTVRSEFKGYDFMKSDSPRTVRSHPYGLDWIAGEVRKIKSLPHIHDPTVTNHTAPHLIAAIH